MRRGLVIAAPTLAALAACGGGSGLSEREQGQYAKLEKEAAMFVDESQVCELVQRYIDAGDQPDLADVWKHFQDEHC